MADSNGAPKGLLMHGFGTGAEQAAGLPGAAVEIVIQGPAVAALTHDGGMAGPVASVLEGGVAVRACENSMRSAAVDAASLLTGVSPVPSAVVHLAQRQWDGWAYVRL